MTASIEKTKSPNGIPVKIKTSSNSMETIFFGTFRKCPALKALSKKYNKMSVGLQKIMKRERFYNNKIKNLDEDLQPEEFDKQLDDLSATLEDCREGYDKLMEEIIDFQKNYSVKSLVAAGYSKEQAEEFASYIPSERFAEVLEATRTGAMDVIDFFTEESPAEQN